jgi:hypothetical protein
LAPYIQQVQALAQKVAQAQQAQQQQMLGQDPTANVIMQTQMAETKRKAEESQARMQMDSKRQEQDYQIKIAELQRKVQELQAKYSTQTSIDNQRNATDVAMANINNAAKERIAMIGANAQISSQQVQLDAEQNRSAMEAINTANTDIRQHGLAVQQQQFEQQSQQVQGQLEAQQAQQAQQQAAQEHQQGLQQADQQHQQGLQQAQEQHEQQIAQMQQQQEQQQAAPQPPQGQ